MSQMPNDEWVEIGAVMLEFRRHLTHRAASLYEHYLLTTNETKVQQLLENHKALLILEK